MKIQRAFDRECDEIDRQLADGKINAREHRQYLSDLEADMRDIEREEEMRRADATREWEEYQ